MGSWFMPIREKAYDVGCRLGALDGVEVHERTEDGRFVVTVEDVNGIDPGDAILEIHRMEGVLSAVLVFHHIEEEARGPMAAA